MAARRDDRGMTGRMQRLFRFPILGNYVLAPATLLRIAAMLTASLIASVLVFSTFHFCQSMHVARFEGASLRFRSALSIFAFAGTLFQLVFLVMVGLRLGWSAALKLLALELVLFIPISFVLAWSAKNVSRDTIPILSLAGFAVMPMAGIMMIRALQHSA
jgi:hypothetical protein